MAKTKKKKQRKPNRNPLLEKKYQEGKWEGIQQATKYFMEKYEILKEQPGIGPVTAEKVNAVFFNQYFTTQPDQEGKENGERKRKQIQQETRKGSPMENRTKRGSNKMGKGKDKQQGS